MRAYACNAKRPAEPQRYDAVLVAIGRVPNGKNLDAGKAGVEVDDRGFIRVDKQLRTNVPPYLVNLKYFLLLYRVY